MIGRIGRCGFVYRRSSIAIPALVLSLLAVGCGDKPAAGPPKIQVKGKVLIDDKPPSKEVMVSFFPEDQEKPAAGSGKTDAEGNFEIEKGGVPAGKYQVTVKSKLKVHDMFPMKYSTRGESSLEVEVKENAPAGAYDIKLSKR